jgi:hypothetical protein
MAVVQTVIEDFQILCVPLGSGYKWSLLQVREGNYKREHGGPRWKLEAETVCISSPGAFKTYADLWERRNPVILIQ